MVEWFWVLHYGKSLCVAINFMSQCLTIPIELPETNHADQNMVQKIDETHMLCITIIFLTKKTETLMSRCKKLLLYFFPRLSFYAVCMIKWSVPCSILINTECDHQPLRVVHRDVKRKYDRSFWSEQ